MKILLLGDTHGSPYQIQYAYAIAQEYECDVIFNLGDFGYWEHMKGGPEFLEVVSSFAVENMIPFCWLDGNHENHPLLRRTYQDMKTPDGFWEIRKYLFYAPRGHRFEWDGVKFMTYGGAFSIDRGYRKIGVSWWWEEEIDPTHVDETIADTRPIDILLSHDVPNGVDIQGVMSIKGKNFRPIKEAVSGRLQLERLVKALQPKEIFHGHYHVRYTQIVDFGYGNVRVTGLDCEQTYQDSWIVLDTEDRYGK